MDPLASIAATLIVAVTPAATMVPPIAEPAETEPSQVAFFATINGDVVLLDPGDQGGAFIPVGNSRTQFVWFSIYPVRAARMGIQGDIAIHCHAAATCEAVRPNDQPELTPAAVALADRLAVSNPNRSYPIDVTLSFRIISKGASYP
jgi:hypothetical protein